MDTSYSSTISIMCLCGHVHERKYLWRPEEGIWNYRHAFVPVDLGAVRINLLTDTEPSLQSAYCW